MLRREDFSQSSVISRGRFPVPNVSLSILVAYESVVLEGGRGTLGLRAKFNLSDGPRNCQREYSLLIAGVMTMPHPLWGLRMAAGNVVQSSR